MVLSLGHVCNPNIYFIFQKRNTQSQRVVTYLVSHKDDGYNVFCLLVDNIDLGLL